MKDLRVGIIGPGVRGYNMFNLTLDVDQALQKSSTT